MDNEAVLLEPIEDRVRIREARRDFLRAFAKPAAITMAGTFASLQSDAIAQTTSTGDEAILNFALNLEYLEAQFYSFASFGTGLSADLLSGTGTRGEATGGRQATFTDPVVRQYAREIANDEIAHVRFLRMALGSAANAQPPIDIGASPTGAFSSAARAAGLIGPGQSFDPYASDENFLLAAYIFEDVGVTAYKGAAPLIANKTFLEAAAGLLAVEAYHASLVRTVLYGKGLQTPSLRTATEAISTARDSLDGPEDKDQGVAGTADTSNIVPLDADGLAYSRTPGEVLNIVYLTNTAAVRGGFFPAGANGGFRTSDAN